MPPMALRSFSPWMTVRVAIGSMVVLAALGACRSATGDDGVDPLACPQTYEFGNYGCGRVMAIIEGPPTPWPASYRFDVRARPAEIGAGAPPTFAREPGVGPVPLQLTLWNGRIAEGDTMSVWVTAQMFEDSRSNVAGASLPIFAVDSALRMVRFAPIGSVPPVDTVHLTLRRP